MSRRIRIADVGYCSDSALLNMHVCVLMPLMKWKLDPTTQTRVSCVERLLRNRT